MQREAVFKRLLDRCKRVRQCPLCGKGAVMYVGPTAPIVWCSQCRLEGVRGLRPWQGAAAPAAPANHALCLRCPALAWHAPQTTGW